MRKALLLLLIGAALSGCGVPSTAATPTAPPSYRASVLADHPIAYCTYVSENFAPGAGGGTSWFQLLNDHHNGRLEFRVTEDNPTLVSSTILDLHTWYYVVATYDGTTAKLFIDGKLDSSVAVAAIAKQTADPLYIGRRADGLFNDAVLDEIAIYPTALSSDR